MTEEELKVGLKRLMDVKEDRCLYDLFDDYNYRSKNEKKELDDDLCSIFGLKKEYPISDKIETKIVARDEYTKHVYFFNGKTRVFQGGKAIYDRDGLLDKLIVDGTGESIYFDSHIRISC